MKIVVLHKVTIILDAAIFKSVDPTLLRKVFIKDKSYFMQYSYFHKKTL